MSDSIWAAIIAATSAMTGGYLDRKFNKQTATRSAIHSERQAAHEREQAEASRRDQVHQEQARAHAARRAERLCECVDHVSQSRAQMREWLDWFERRRKWSPIDARPADASERACAVVMVDFPDIYRLARAYHDATHALDLAIRDRGQGGDASAELVDWERTYEDLGEGIVALSQKELSVQASDAGFDGAPDDEVASTQSGIKTRRNPT